MDIGRVPAASEQDKGKKARLLSPPSGALHPLHLRVIASHAAHSKGRNLWKYAAYLFSWGSKSGKRPVSIHCKGQGQGQPDHGLPSWQGEYTCDEAPIRHSVSLFVGSTRRPVQEPSPDGAN